MDDNNTIDVELDLLKLSSSIDCSMENFTREEFLSVYLEGEQVLYPFPEHILVFSCKRDGDINLYLYRNGKLFPTTEKDLREMLGIGVSLSPVVKASILRYFTLSDVARAMSNRNLSFKTMTSRDIPSVITYLVENYINPLDTAPDYVFNILENYRRNLKIQ